ncbi:MAG: hypothetical protein J0I06_19750 [Planctomycetes bacterium]|nr:hypothetical protein [Planctomycetota bacterium]
MKALFRVAVFGLLAACLAGCSKGGVKKVTVDGTVSYRGQRVTSGILRVVSAGGEFATTPIRADGTFTLTDVVPGDVQVGIMEAPRAASSSDGKGGPAARPVPIPAKYKDPQKSDLRYTISDDTPALNIELR